MISGGSDFNRAWCGFNYSEAGKGWESHTVKKAVRYSLPQPASRLGTGISKSFLYGAEAGDSFFSILKMEYLRSNV